MSEKRVSIKGLEKYQVLQALFADAKPLGMGFLSYVPGPMSDENAKRIADNCLSYDYLEGRVIKCDISKDDFDPWGYDRDNGKDSAEMAILKLRAML